MQQRIYGKGRSTKGWLRASAVKKMADLKPGTLLIGVSHQFKAENLYKVIPCPHDPPGPEVKAGRLVYVQYCKPNGQLIEPINIQALWYWELNQGRQAWFFAKRPRRKQKLAA